MIFSLCNYICILLLCSLPETTRHTHTTANHSITHSLTQPFFDSFVALVGALQCAPLSLLFPCGLFLGAAAQQKLSVSIWEKVVQYVICGVAVLLMVMGTISAVRDILETESFGMPFDCFCDATPDTCCASGFQPVNGEYCNSVLSVSVWPYKLGSLSPGHV